MAYPLSLHTTDKSFLSGGNDMNCNVVSVKKISGFESNTQVEY